MPLYLNALPGGNVHLVTVNDYLAKRDMEWMGPVYEGLGMRAGFIRNMMPFAERKEAYAADITYGTNSEFGFDYLRDNMATSLEGTVQRSHAYAIVDEVDSILIDEARTPLIISGEPETAAKTYYDFARVVRGLRGVSDVLDAVADGDLTRTATVQSKDELGAMARSLNRATAGMREAVQAMLDSSSALATSSDGLSQVAGSMAAAAE